MIASKYYKKMNETIPGPSDYDIIPSKFLRNHPRVTIGSAPKDNVLVNRSRSPGVGSYNADYNKLKKRSKSIIFSTQKRAGLINHRETSPGPGAYKIPCRFYDKPAFMYKKENKFRFV